MAWGLSSWTFAAGTRDRETFPGASCKLDSEPCEGSFQDGGCKSPYNHGECRHQRKSNYYKGWNYISRHSPHISFYDSRLSRIHASGCTDSVRLLTEAGKKGHSQGAT